MFDKFKQRLKTDKALDFNKFSEHPKVKLGTKIVAGIITAIIIISTLGGLYVKHFETTDPAMTGIELKKIKPKAANITPLVRYQLNNKQYGIVNYSASDGIHSAILDITKKKIVKDELVDMSANGNNPMVLAQLLDTLYHKQDIALQRVRTSKDKITINQTTYQVNVHATNLTSYVNTKSGRQTMVKHNPNYLLLGDGTQRTFKKETVNPKTVQVTLLQFDRKTKENVITLFDYHSGKHFKLTLDLENNVSLYNLE